MGERRQRDIHELESELLQLEPSTRATLAKTLIASLEDLSEDEYERLLAEEAEARYADFLTGRTTAVDGDEVFARAGQSRPSSGNGFLPAASTASST